MTRAPSTILAVAAAVKFAVRIGPRPIMLRDQRPQLARERNNK